jgi:L-ascorbate metabolism protein UlaG (beta-lactamase superfamily)
MEIRWFGHACFLIKTKKETKEELNILIDPFSEEIGLKLPRIEADILLITHNHYDHNNPKPVKGDYFLVDGPGEYEVKNIFIKGIFSYHDDSKGEERGENTIYLIETEDIKICHLGDLGQKELTPEQIEEIGEVDILLVPVGGVYTIDGKAAQKIINQIEPRVVIPMHYSLPKLKIKLDSVQAFLKAFGQEDIEPQPKLLIRKEKLPAQTLVVLLKI